MAHLAGAAHLSGLFEPASEGNSDSSREANRNDQNRRSAESLWGIGTFNRNRDSSASMGLASFGLPCRIEFPDELLGLLSGSGEGDIVESLKGLLARWLRRRLHRGGPLGDD